MTAKATTFEIDRVQGNDINESPIKNTRVRYCEIIVLARAVSVITYGWTLQWK